MPQLDSSVKLNYTRGMSKAQLKRDTRAILTVLPKDGTPMTMAEVLLRAGEGLYRAMNDLVEAGRVRHLMINGLNAYAVVDKDTRL